MSFLYQYIVNPRQVLADQSSTLQLVSVGIVMLLLAVFQSVQMGSFGFLSLTVWILWMGFGALVGSFLIDTTAQFLGYEPKGVLMAQWLILSRVPLLLTPVLGLLIPDSVLVTLGVGIMVLILMVWSIKAVYQTRLRDLIMIMILPVLAIMGFITLTTFYIGSLMI